MTVSGFPSGSPIGFSVNGRFANTYAGEDPQGDGTYTVGTPVYDEIGDVTGQEKPLTVRASSTVVDDQGNATDTTATATAREVDGFSVTVRPGNALPATRQRITVRGATELTPVYYHVLRFPFGWESGARGQPPPLTRTNHPTARTFLLGTPAGPCGTLTKTVRAVPTAIKLRSRSVYERFVDLSAPPSFGYDSSAGAPLSAIRVYRVRRG
ncbi:MAG: hypothetical protein QOE65_1871 [Solirubrobacteraceae bacterium]|nr:hypothetical protein [Solirubrobacteraceae bacterium]